MYLDFTLKKYIKENYEDLLTKNKLYKVDYIDEEYEFICVYNNKNYTTRCNIKDFIEPTIEDYKIFIKEEILNLYNEIEKELEKADKDYNNFYYEHQYNWNNDKELEKINKKEDKVLERTTYLKKILQNYELILKYMFH